MSVPHPILILGRSAYLTRATQLTFSNPKSGNAGRVRITRTFHVYLELAMQAKHDVLIRGYCHRNNIASRNTDGTQFSHNNNVIAANLLEANGFYWRCSAVAADLAMNRMVELWGAQPAFAESLFKNHTIGNSTNSYHRQDIRGQNIIRADGNCYEASFWYGGQDIYVLYHCYPPRR